MSGIALILTLSAIIWYCVDRFKPIWSSKSWGKYVTTAVAGLLGAIAVFGYNLDLIYAMGVAVEITLAGKLLTVLTLMCGSSAISEVITRLKVEEK